MDTQKIARVGTVRYLVLDDVGPYQPVTLSVGYRVCRVVWPFAHRNSRHPGIICTSIVLRWSP